METRSDNTLFAVAAVISAGVVLASGYLGYLTPERRWPYLVAIAVVCCAWIVRYLMSRRHQEGDPKTQLVRRKLTRAVIVAGLMLGSALGGVLMARFGWTVGFLG